MQLRREPDKNMAKAGTRAMMKQLGGMAARACAGGLINASCKASKPIEVARLARTVRIVAQETLR